MTLFNLFGLHSQQIFYTGSHGGSGSGTTPPVVDTAVDGEATGEVMGLGYDDSNAPTDQGGQVITENADLIYGNGGDDTIDGAGGDDTILGDSAGPSGTDTHEIFSWADAPGFGNNNSAGSFTQDTGNANITFTILAGDAVNEYETDTQNTSNLDSEVAENASFESLLDSNNDSAEYTWESDVTLENVEFRINDIDGDGVVRVVAFDADGNEIEVIMSREGSGLDLSSSNGLPGNDTATSNDDNYANDNAYEHSVLVTIPGPVSEFRVIHEQDGYDDSGINITDITYDVMAFDTGAAGDDSIDGGDGADLIYGQAGGDTINGEAGNDTIYGDDGDLGDDTDLIVNGSFEDTTGMTDTGYGYVSTGSMVGWTTSDPSHEIDVHDDDRGGVAPSDGDNWADLAATPGDIRIGQDVAGIQDGEEYTLTFDAADGASSPGGENTIGVYWGGVLIDTIDPAQGTMNTYTYTLIGGAGDGSNRLEFSGTPGDSDNYGASIDSVSLVGPGPVSGVAGDDSLTGGIGDDEIYGEAGDDTIVGGAGADSISGGDDADLIIGGNGGDTVDGGTDGDDNDVLDLTGLGPIEFISQTTDADGDSTSGVLRFIDTGETMEFFEIEEILHDAGPVDGLDTGEDMAPGYTDAEGDQIDGTDGDDDTIFGNGGDDTIDSGVGDDTVDAGDGDDVIELTGGIDNDVLIGGEGDEDGGGDTLDSSGITDDLTLDLTAPETGTLTDGVNTTDFEEIENFVLGSGDDTVTGSTGDDNVNAGEGNNTLDGGEGDDTLLTGGGMDTIDGGDGDDSIDSGNGDDTVFGGSGSDTVDGGHGDNVIDTSGGDPRPDIGFPSYGPFPAVPADTDPDDDRDLVTTFSGNDSITTGDDADTISSGAGHDTIDSGIDDDVVEAGGGNDLITTGEGNDSVDAGSGNDTVYGGLGPSVPDGLNIPDAPGTGPFGPDPVDYNGQDTIDGGSGHDVIYGEDDDDLIYGGTGADTLDGGIDDDTIFGDEGQDDLIGGQGADSMSGGDDRDEFIIDNREDAFGDTIDGGTGGNDVDTLDLTGFGPYQVFDTDGVTPLDLTTFNDADGDSFSGVIRFTDGAGTVEGTLEFSEIENLIICFTPGSRIATPRGEVEVQDLRAGDRVITRDDGVQEINWIGKKKLSATDLIADPKLRPVLIRKGSLGNGLPERDMMVSPNHRMLMANSQTQVLFDEREVLVAAKHLVGQPGVHQIDTLGTEYVHVMFERHEVILGDGTWTESFQPGDHSLSGIDVEQRDEIFSLFPSLQNAEGRRSYGAARQSLKAHEAKLLRQTMGSE